MTETSLQELLTRVAAGHESVPAALETLRTLPFTQAAHTLADTHREIRQGFPEAVFSRHKNAEQVLEALDVLYRAHGYALATHVSPDTASRLESQFTSGVYQARSRIYTLHRMPARPEWGHVSVVCAGTSDLAVAEEALHTLHFAGVQADLHHDVGVAGLHRLLDRLEVLRRSRAIIAVAGMEGTLPGVLGGLVSQPVIAVPTSVGYGAATGGFSALLTMLTSCTGGVAVMNIDNGFGAALCVLRLLRTAPPVPVNS